MTERPLVPDPGVTPAGADGGPVEVTVWIGDEAPIVARFETVEDAEAALERLVESADAVARPVSGRITDLAHSTSAASIDLTADDTTLDETALDELDEAYPHEL